MTYKVAGQLASDSDDATEPVEIAPSPLLDTIRRQLLAELPEKRFSEGEDEAYWNDDWNEAIDQCIEAINRILKHGGEK